MSENKSVPMSNWEWDGIVNEHADTEAANHRAADADGVQEAKKQMFDNFYEKSEQRRRERTAITAVRYAMLAVGLTAVAYLVRDITGLALALGVVAAGFGLTAAYGAGKYREM